jgi:DNA-binding NarL/FixJ family response regulator
MNTVRTIKVFLADDSMVLRERVLDMLCDIPGVEVLGCAEDALHAIDCIRRLRPDAVIVDIQMPHGSGLDILKNLRAVNVRIVFTNFPYPQYRKRALDCGADYFFDKTTEFEKLRELFAQLTGALEPQPAP